MSATFGNNVLSVFDVWDDSREFVAHLIESADTPVHETKRLVDESLLANAQDWHYLVRCARSIQQSEPRSHKSLDGNDVLTFVWHILASQSRQLDLHLQPWAETDRLIYRAEQLAINPDIQGPRYINSQEKVASAKRTSSRPKLVKQHIKSHYWSDEADHPGKLTSHATKLEGVCGQNTSSAIHVSCPINANTKNGPLCSVRNVASVLPSAVESSGTHKIECSYLKDPATGFKVANQCPTPQVSHYFTATIKANSAKRPPAGIVSSVPFPPLWAPQFGLIQEKMAHEPFWLLVAVTFLIKTSGQAAIPVFYKVKERFPRPEDLADPGNAEELLQMIRHLGLAMNRLGFIQKYAMVFVCNPPASMKRYGVRNYDSRDTQPVSAGPQSQRNGCKLELGTTCAEKDTDAWEIGHLTQGKYTLDSWRIFCRDVLLGRALDWNGKGREPEFQPEWMRVSPLDKELRAYLRWMWMREGWEWDPETGERTVLRHELQTAVNEHRVEYDDTGGLRILSSGWMTE